MAVKLIMLFAKSPRPGHVKTRLIPPLTPESAAELHTAFVLDMAHRFRNLHDTDFELHTDIESDAFAELTVARKLQISGDLGLKMVHALEQGLSAGYQRVAILGSDAPTVPSKHVLELLSSSADVAFGPATDGGFYAIAASATRAAMFDGVAWSQPDTLAQTIQAVRRADLSVQTGEEWFDVDQPADLEKLAASESLPPHTAAFFARMLGSAPAIGLQDSV